MRADVPGAPPVTQFRTQKTGALLGYLAYHADRDHPREELIEILWPEDDRDSGRHKLSVALSSLRAQLEPTGVPDGAVLLTGRLTAHLNPSAFITDAGEFEAALRAAEGEAEDGRRIARLARAVELYRGRLLPGCYEEWILPEQQRLNERYLGAISQLVRLLTGSGKPEEAMQHALAATAVDPLREEPHREVIRLYQAMGHPDAALRQYSALERLLSDAFGTRPSAATTALLEEAPAASPLADLTTAPRISLPSEPRPNGAATVSPLEECVGGAVPLDSCFYVRRPADSQFAAAAERRDSIVLLKGASQAGKTSLLARGLRDARAAGARVIRTDFLLFNAGRLASAETLLHTLAETIKEQLDLEPRPEAPAGLGGPNLAFRRFLRRDVLGANGAPLVWGMDGVDRLFSCPFGSEIFELFRSLHNERAFDPDGPWCRLTLAIAYATEAHLFITDPNRSPFNVGTRIELEDFTPNQVRDLNDRYGCPLRDSEPARLHRLVGGHPYLVRRGLHELAVTGESFAALEAQAHRDEWIFGDHLRRLRALLARDPELGEAVGKVLRGHGCPTRESFYRLRSAGVLAGDSAGDARLRCELYATYLRQHLLDTDLG